MSPREPFSRAVAILRAILYLRISDLTDTSTSIPRQEKAGRGRAEDLGAEVIKVFKDEASEIIRIVYETGCGPLRLRRVRVPHLVRHCVRPQG